MTDHEAEVRAGYIAGLRALADLLDAHPELPIPYAGSHSRWSPLTMHVLDGENQRERFAAAVAALPGLRTKSVRDNYYDVTTQLHGLYLQVTAFRDEVCERVVTGTREVTQKVLPPDALANIEMVEVTETVEDVQWVCAPLGTATA